MHKKTFSNQGAPLTFTADQVGPVKGGHHVRKHTYGGTFGMMSPTQQNAGATAGGGNSVWGMTSPVVKSKLRSHRNTNNLVL